MCRIISNSAIKSRTAKKIKTKSSHLSYQNTQLELQRVLAPKPWKVR
uniref:Uncharacterized protein n=1 Tax=Rhizophora mucronata TaxID=61149 RepID=A0A2P2PQ47_RHIMU